MKHISVTDTTIRQAGKAAGYTLSFREKIELAKLLDRLQNLAIAVLSLSFLFLLVQTPLFGDAGDTTIASTVRGWFTDRRGRTGLPRRARGAGAHRAEQRLHPQRAGRADDRG